MNPFIELYQHPIESLGWLGYLLAMAAVIMAALPWSIRQVAKLIVQYKKNAHGSEWWAFGDRSRGYIPPAGWLARLCGVLVVLAVVAWALGTVVFLLS
jgi:hypothetical protein